MSLSAMQLQLVRMLAGQRQPPGSCAGGALSEHEQQWLEGIENSCGGKVTRDVINWWRKARLHTALPLTLRLLQQRDLAGQVERYLQQSACFTLFAALEGRQFLQFLVNNNGAMDILSLATFELELREAHTVRRENGLGARRYRKTVVFPCDPSALICAVLNGMAKELDCRELTYVEVDSHLPQLWQCLGSEPPSSASPLTTGWE